MAAALPPGTPPGTLSPDRNWQWDGAAWRPVSGAAPTPGNVAGTLSPDGRFLWDGTTWRPVSGVAPTRPWYREPANESLIAIPFSLFCFLFAIAGLVEGIRGLRTPYQTRAIVGIVINALLLGLWTIGLIVKAAGSITTH